MARVRRFESDFPSKSMKVHHVGWTVNHRDASIRFYEKLGFECISSLLIDDEHIAFMKKGSTLIELVEGNVNEHPHVCFEVEDIKGMSKDLGLTVLGGPYTIPEKGWTSYFFESGDGSVVELLTTER